MTTKYKKMKDENYWGKKFHFPKIYGKAGELTINN